jgi:hypothetical protein
MNLFNLIPCPKPSKKFAAFSGAEKGSGKPPQTKGSALFTRHNASQSAGTAFASAPLLRALCLGLAVPLTIQAALAETATNPPVPITARDFYNAGTKLLAAQKFSDAEKMLQSSLAAQDERVQPATLFNLGHARFGEGMEILKKGPDAQKVSAQADAAVASGRNAIRAAESALAENQLDKLVATYLQGRGARRELRAAEKAVKSAMENRGKTLQKWQGAADDFHGAAELNPADTNAQRNAEIVERHLAILVDELQRMQQSAAQLAGQRQQLGQLMAKLKGQIPAPDAPPGGEDGDEDEDGKQPEDLAGQQENAPREGEQMQVPVSPDVAAQLLDGLSLESTRRLPMISDKEGAKPQDKKGRNW